MNEKEVIVERGTNKELLIVSAGAISIAVVAGYYIYSKNRLINEYTSLVNDYEREIKEFRQDGVIDEDEERILNQKEERLSLLEHQITHNFLTDLINALAKLGIVVSAGYISAQVVKYIRRKYPPRPPKCPYCGKDLRGYSDEQIKKHIDSHHNEPLPEKAPTTWTMIKKLPSLLKDLIAWMAKVPRDYLDKDYNEIPEAARWKIYVAVIEVIVILIAAGIFLWYLVPIAGAAGLPIVTA